MSKVASDSGHWYDAKTGEPRYTVKGKNGKERPTRITDAREKGYVPSVTTITKVMAAPGLTKWLQRQVLLSALTLPRKPDESEDDYAERVMEDAEEQSFKAREQGTEFHGRIERFLSSRAPLSEADDAVQAVLRKCIDADVPILEGKAEKSFACADGYGGKVDWNDGAIIVDFKTKDTIKDEKKLAYNEHVMQLAAYAHGMGIENPRCLNVFIGVRDGKVVVHDWPAHEIERGLRMFKLCLALWQEINNWTAHLSASESLDRQLKAAGW